MLDFSFSSKQKMTAFYLGNFKAKMVLFFVSKAKFLWFCCLPVFWHFINRSATVQFHGCP